MRGGLAFRNGLKNKRPEPGEKTYILRTITLPAE